MCAPALQELIETPITISIATIIESFFILYVLVYIIKNCAAVDKNNQDVSSSEPVGGWKKGPVAAIPCYLTSPRETSML